jgi:hypothetical protein
MINASEIRLATQAEHSQKRCGGSGSSSCLSQVRYVLVGKTRRCKITRPLCAACAKVAAVTHKLALPPDGGPS